MPQHAQCPGKQTEGIDTQYDNQCPDNIDRLCPAAQSREGTATTARERENDSNNQRKKTALREPVYRLRQINGIAQYRRPRHHAPEVCRCSVRPQAGCTIILGSPLCLPDTNGFAQPSLGQGHVSRHQFGCN